MSFQVLAVNAGSSSLKFCLFNADPAGLDRRLAGRFERLGEATAFQFELDGAEGGARLTGVADHAAAIRYLLDWLGPRLDKDRALIAGHRIVHGGDKFVAPTRVDDRVFTALQGLSALAPLHQPTGLLAIEALSKAAPAVPQVACFDTAFHAAHAKTARLFALPARFYEQGIRRYGFHGLSYESIAAELAEREPELARGRLIIAHLGNGASLCALQNGQSVDSSMGFSTLDGLMMGTRCGSIDAGALLYLLESGQMTPAGLSELLYRRAGLLGVSGISRDMRELLASGAASAAEAVDLFVYHVIRAAGGLIALLKGLDGLVFTGGIGEHQPEIRRRVSAGLDWLGLKLDTRANRGNRRVISEPASRIALRVIPADEERLIARHTLRTINSTTPANDRETTWHAST